MNIEKEVLESVVVSIVFEDSNKELLDIDEIFKKTNREFPEMLKNLNLDISFDFSNRDIKKLYTTQFLLTFVEYIKNRNRTEKLYLFSNQLTKDAFRNRLIHKLKTIFGFTVLEQIKDLNEIFEKITESDCETVSHVELFLNTERKLKSLKQIKKYLNKNGLTYLNDVYFNELSNKLCLFV
jgi:hypothetical protein